METRLLCNTIYFTYRFVFRHWAYWDLNVFVSSLTGKLVLDLNQIIHVRGFGIISSDSFGVVGSIRFVKPIYSVIGLAPFCYGVISSNHIVAGFFGICIGLWHIIRCNLRSDSYYIEMLDFVISSKV